jgi:hypothetical protein
MTEPYPALSPTFRLKLGHFPGIYVMGPTLTLPTIRGVTPVGGLRLVRASSWPGCLASFRGHLAPYWPHNEAMPHTPV